MTVAQKIAIRRSIAARAEKAEAEAQAKLTAKRMTARRSVFVARARARKGA